AICDNQLFTSSSPAPSVGRETPPRKAQRGERISQVTSDEIRAATYNPLGKIPAPSRFTAWAASSEANTRSATPEPRVARQRPNQHQVLHGRKHVLLPINFVCHRRADQPAARRHVPQRLSRRGIERQ